MTTSGRQTMAVFGGVIVGLSVGGMVQSIADVYQGHFVPLGGAAGLGLGIMFAALVPAVDPSTPSDAQQRQAAAASPDTAEVPASQADE